MKRTKATLTPTMTPMMMPESTIGAATSPVPARRFVALEGVRAHRALVRDLAARPRAEPERRADVRGRELPLARLEPLGRALLQCGRHHSTSVPEDLTSACYCRMVETRSAYRSGGSMRIAAMKTPPRNKKTGQFTAVQKATLNKTARNFAANKIAAAARARQSRKKATAFFAYAGPSKCGQGRKTLKAGERTNRNGTKQGRPGVRCP